MSWVLFLIVAIEKKIFDFTNTFNEVSKNAIESASNNSFDWSRCCIVDDVKILNQKIFALIALYDAFLKNSLVENMKISIAINMSSLKHLMNMNDFAIETFDFDITLDAHSKNSSTQHIENSKTSKKNSIFIYELSALFAFDLSIDIDIQIYTVDSIISKLTYSIIETFVMFFRRKLQLSSFRDFALRNISFDWSRCCTNSINSRISVRSKNSKSSKDCDSNFVKQFDHRSSNDHEENQSQSFYNSINDTLNRLKLSVEIYRARTIE